MVHDCLSPLDVPFSHRWDCQSACGNSCGRLPTVSLQAFGTSCAAYPLTPNVTFGRCVLDTLCNPVRKAESRECDPRHLILQQPSHFWGGSQRGRILDPAFLQDFGILIFPFRDYPEKPNIHASIPFIQFLFLKLSHPSSSVWEASNIFATKFYLLRRITDPLLGKFPVFFFRVRWAPEL